jgi:hypothetical protein
VRSQGGASGGGISTLVAAVLIRPESDVLNQGAFGYLVLNDIYGLLVFAQRLRMERIYLVGFAAGLLGTRL